MHSKWTTYAEAMLVKGIGLLKQAYASRIRDAAWKNAVALEKAAFYPLYNGKDRDLRKYRYHEGWHAPGGIQGCHPGFD